MQWLLVVRLQLVLILALELFLLKIQVNGDLFVLLELHDDEGVPGLTLAQGWVEANNEHAMHLIWLRKHHKLLDGLVLNLVVVGLATKAEGRFVHVDVETTSEKGY